MSVWSDWGDALAGPFESYYDTFKTLFTNPGKLRAKDIPTLVLPIPGAGSTITYDLDHPTAAVYQLGTLAGIDGGLQAVSAVQYGSDAYAQAAISQGAEAQIESSLPGATLADVAPDSALSGLTDEQLAANAGTGSYLYGTPQAESQVASDNFLSGLGADIKGVATGTADFIKGTSEVSLAARAALSPWQRAVGSAKEFASRLTGGGAPVNVSGGGSGLPAPPAAAAPKAALASVPLVLGVGALAGVALWLWRRRK